MKELVPSIRAFMLDCLGKPHIQPPAGAIRACVGSPANLALIRKQADATLPPAQCRNYTNAFHALYRITASEGVLALWKGAGPTVVRAIALNMGMLASYDQSVEFFKDNLGFGEAYYCWCEFNIRVLCCCV